MLVSIALITCQRPQSLLRLLTSIEALSTTAQIEIVVVDNDPAGSALPVLANYKSKHELKVLHEPVQGIPYARNAALRVCAEHTDYIAMLDDDEVVTPNWLSAMLQAMEATKADAIGGPVEPLYPANKPEWVIKGKFFERDERQDGAPQRVLITNNCVLRAATWRAKPVWFDTRLRYTGSSDTLFFMMASKADWHLSWNNSAIVQEHVPQQRLTAAWLIQRQYRIGNGLALCDILANGYAKALPMRLVKAALYIIASCLHLLAAPVQGYAAFVKAQQRWARARGTLTALMGYKYEEYAPQRVVGDKHDHAA